MRRVSPCWCADLRRVDVAADGDWLVRAAEDRIAAFVGIALLQGAVCLAAALQVWRGSGSRSATVAAVLAVAAAMRLAVLAAPPYLSSDIYRYVWDGRVAAAGINPYRYIPTDPQLEHLRDPEIFPGDQP